MADRLTDKTALSTAPADADLVHLVDVSDTTSNAAGTSKKQTAKNFLSRGLTSIQGCHVLARTTAGASTTALVAGDTVLYVSTTQLIVARLKGAVSTIPDDLVDDTYAYTFLNLSPAL